MPAQLRRGLVKEPTPSGPRHKPAQPRQDRVVSWPQSKPVPLTTENRQIMTEYDALDGQFILFVPAKPE